MCYKITDNAWITSTLSSRVTILDQSDSLSECGVYAEKISNNLAASPCSNTSKLFLFNKTFTIAVTINNFLNLKNIFVFFKKVCVLSQNCFIKIVQFSF